MEYSSVTFGSMLPKYENNRLENIQKKCLRIIYGYGLDYDTLLQKSDLETLKKKKRESTSKICTKSVSKPTVLGMVSKEPKP